ncbi:MAG: hypothetical protein QOF92_2166 [Pseudonocardiales bacterium]|nr:hypothetical protein [Pseudonocardiales bacterium]
MAATGSGLSDEQIVQLRDDVAAGRSPRVQVAGSQFGNTAAATVRRVGDPSVDGEDFVTVRVKLNGVTDDLRFAPRELSRGKRGQAKSPAKTLAPRAAKDPAPSPRKRQPRRPASRQQDAEVPAPTARRAQVPEISAKQPRKPARRAPTSAPVSIVVSSVDASWTVSAQRGSRSVLKNAAVNPGVVSAIAALLDQPALEDAVAAVNDTARAEAETRAEQLRAELAQIQAVLDSHRRP